MSSKVFRLLRARPIAHQPRPAPLFRSLLSRSSLHTSPLSPAHIRRSTLSITNAASVTGRRAFSLSSITSRLSPAFRRLRSVRYNSTKPPTPNPTSHLGSPEPTSLSQRLKKLSKEYGWSALGVYLFLTVLDFPFCFLAVRAIGTEKIGHYEHVAMEYVRKVLPIPERKRDPESDLKEDIIGVDDDLERQDIEAKKNGGDATLGTQLVLAYAIHKSFIFIRVPLTAALTPKIVKTLRGWGWNIGKKKTK